MNYHAHKLLTTILSLTNYCQEVFRPRQKFPGWAMPTLIFSRVGACPPCSPRAGAHGLGRWQQAQTKQPIGALSLLIPVEYIQPRCCKDRRFQLVLSCKKNSNYGYRYFSAENYIKKERYPYLAACSIRYGYLYSITCLSIFAQGDDVICFVLCALLWVHNYYCFKNKNV